MVQKLNQVIAVEKGVKQRNNDVGSELVKAVKKPALFNGFAKKYKPLEENNEQFPPETLKVQMTTSQVLKDSNKVLADLLDVTATKDHANCNAKADVKVDGETLLKEVPATYLLFLEKQLTDMHTLVAEFPVLDASEEWALDENAGLYKTDVSQTHKTKKVQKALVMYPATDKHPAQTQLITDDQTVGHWETVKMSGAMPLPDKTKLLEKIEKLQKAVKFAREEANTTLAPDVSVSDKLLGWLFK